MMRKFIIPILFFITLSGSVLSQSANVTISGIRREYAGKELEFFIYKERIFNKTESVAKTTTDSTGAFSVSFLLTETKCVYCQTPIYTSFIFAEPGKTYKVQLPPATVKNAENTNNPFFISPLWNMLSSAESRNGKMELNAAIDSFNKQFDPFLDKQLLLYYDPVHNREKLDSFILAINKLPEPENKEYYSSYKLYKFASLGFMENQFNYNDLFEKYIKKKPQYTDVPSWWEFFNLYFDGYFSSLSSKKEFSDLYPLIGKGSYFALNQLLIKDTLLQNKKIREWAILKELHKEYYQNGLPVTSLFALCDSLSASSSDSISKSMVRTLKMEVSSLLIGQFPPHAILKNTEGDSIELSSLQGKYSYIGFCSLDNIGCQKEFEYLKYFYHKHGKFLDFIIILPESEKDRIASYTYENSIPWKFWYMNNRDVLKLYNVKAFPMFYLVDREGKLILSPAILPSAGFEKYLFQLLKGKGEI
jgi:hypothetical protein